MGVIVGDAKTPLDEDNYKLEVEWPKVKINVFFEQFLFFVIKSI